jgi:hypothetical protein
MGGSESRIGKKQGVEVGMHGGDGYAMIVQYSKRRKIAEAVAGIVEEDRSRSRSKCGGRSQSQSLKVWPTNETM